IDDPRYQTPALRLENKPSLQRELEATFLKRPSAEWLRRLAERGVPAAPINTVDRVVADPQIRHREMLVDLEVDGHPVTVLGNPLKISGVEQTYSPPPTTGQHTAAVLSECLG